MLQLYLYILYDIIMIFLVFLVYLLMIMILKIDYRFRIFFDIQGIFENFHNNNLLQVFNSHQLGIFIWEVIEYVE